MNWLPAPENISRKRHRYCSGKGLAQDSRGVHSHVIINYGAKCDLTYVIAANVVTIPKSAGKDQMLITTKSCRTQIAKFEEGPDCVVFRKTRNE